MAGSEDLLDSAYANVATVMTLYHERLNQKTFSLAQKLVAPSFEAPGGMGMEGFLGIIRLLHAVSIR